MNRKQREIHQKIKTVHNECERLIYSISVTNNEVKECKVCDPIHLFTQQNYLPVEFTERNIPEHVLTSLLYDMNEYRDLILEYTVDPN